MLARAKDPDYSDFGPTLLAEQVERDLDHASHFGQRCGPEDKTTRTIIGPGSR